ncbi:iron-sulfur cluster assembly protein CyaY [Sideroxyarcus emersonii]|uniref:Iron-sulfur cluster assembly protein CyaY n=1 Tax=Sideroxyarcus emersonii TaxID=2764705 RepID=A0AAN1X8C9_9PROT|nr:iron donor protein CyaY [Sideroxyarcus emersonii]BCK86611.1 iron-sulfur cluster assembly protein CyaY [Sideroxyarcus emersonii]
MTESEFNEQADAVFRRIERAIDDGDADIDYDSNGTVLEMDFADGSKVIINRHVPNREIWLAAKSGGFHYALQDGRWISQRDGSELFARLGELVQLGAGTKLVF